MHNAKEIKQKLSTSSYFFTDATPSVPSEKELNNVINCWTAAAHGMCKGQFPKCVTPLCLFHHGQHLCDAFPTVCKQISEQWSNKLSFHCHTCGTIGFPLHRKRQPLFSQTQSMHYNKSFSLLYFPFLIACANESKFSMMTSVTNRRNGLILRSLRG